MSAVKIIISAMPRLRVLVAAKRFRMVQADENMSYLHLPLSLLAYIDLLAEPIRESDALVSET